jgi:hypothetical protein
MISISHIITYEYLNTQYNLAMTYIRYNLICDICRYRRQYLKV